MKNRIDCIHLTFSRHACPCESSKCLLQSMHIHTGCTSLSFPHCAFSNVISMHPHTLIKIHIGCIFVTLFCYVSSNVPLTRVCESRFCHIGYICSHFLQRVFSYVISIYLALYTCSCSCCSQTFFFNSMCLQMSPQVPNKKGCKITPSAFVNLFRTSYVSFQM